MYIMTNRYTISGATLSLASSRFSRIDSGTTTESNNIKITRIVGYK